MSWANRDVENYRSGYPGLKDDPSANENVQFYTGQIPSRPSGDFVDNIHKNWWGNWSLLESHHAYIQWLFPIREQGLNSSAQPLELHEAETIKNNPAALNRVRRSYEMMLAFYGMRLKDNHGNLERSDQWEERYDNLNTSSHNYLRITRILKCLGEMGFEKWKKPFIMFILDEVYNNGKLKRTIESCADYWLPVLRDDDERAECQAAFDAMEGQHKIYEQEKASWGGTWSSSSWGGSYSTYTYADNWNEDGAEEEEPEIVRASEPTQLWAQQYPPNQIGPVELRDADDHYQKGTQGYEAGQWMVAELYLTKALRCLSGAIDEDSKITQEKVEEKQFLIYFARAKAFVKLKRFEMAVKDCNNALDYMPDHTALRCIRAQMFDKLGRTHKSEKLTELAKEDIQHALRVEPENTNVQKIYDRLIGAAQSPSP